MSITGKKNSVTKIGKIIKSLMSESGISEAELARQVSLPQTTINRLLLGGTTDPRASTLKPIAKYFLLTVGQLLGDEPIPESRTSGSFLANNRDAWTNLPIIQWEESIPWLFRNENYDLYSHKDWIATERKVSKKAFSLRSTPSMEPVFRKNSILIVDPDAELMDGKYIVVTMDGISVVIRKIQKDGSITYLKNFDKSLPTNILDRTKHRVLGVIVESRIDMYK
jgi:SOS-response transcriptional repressor LexA